MPGTRVARNMAHCTTPKGRYLTLVHLTVPGTSLLLSTSSGEAEVVHWGRELRSIPEPDALARVVPLSAVEAPVIAGIVPQASSGWRGRRGLRGHRPGASPSAFSPRFAAESVIQQDDAEVTIEQADTHAGLVIRSTFRMHPGGLLEVQHTLRNDGDTDYQLDELALVLPVPAHATEILDLTGRWCRERSPQRRAVQQGTWVRSARHARTGHDASLLFAAGTPGFGNRFGEVWGIHFAWSGDHEVFADTLADGRTMIGASELLASGEIVLAPGTEYATPPLFAAHSDSGLDGVSRSFHAWFRRRPHHVTAPNSPGRGKPRPVLLNTWEAVYLDHDLDTLRDLAGSAADLGVERFVLDDGWFRGRRTDRTALGDWYVDPVKWPDGLGPLIDEVRSHGMEFGLWVEPEMISPDSDVARAHPDWIARPGPGQRLAHEWRAQQVIDLVNPDAWQYVYERLNALLTEYTIDYLKWDQNRDHQELGHGGRPSVHAQTVAVYRLLDALRAAHPTVEIESCSSGGARVDLGILQRTDRVWASDCNDALERANIHRWTELVVPPELVGSHVGPGTAHTTGRTHALTFRGITALAGHFGIEWDIRKIDAAERGRLRELVQIYKAHRSLLHTGEVVHADLPDPSLELRGVVNRSSPTGECAAIFSLIRTATSPIELPIRVPFPSLDPQRHYRVEQVFPMDDTSGSGPDALQLAPTCWSFAGITVSGEFLSEVGIAVPNLNPERGILIRFTGT